MALRASTQRCIRKARSTEQRLRFNAIVERLSSVVYQSYRSFSHYFATKTMWSRQQRELRWWCFDSATCVDTQREPVKCIWVRTNLIKPSDSPDDFIAQKRDDKNARHPSTLHGHGWYTPQQPRGTRGAAPQTRACAWTGGNVWALRNPKPPRTPSSRRRVHMFGQRSQRLSRVVSCAAEALQRVLRWPLACVVFRGMRRGFYGLRRRRTVSRWTRHGKNEAFDTFAFLCGLCARIFAHRFDPKQVS